MSEKRFIVFPNNVVWDNQLNEVVCRCILEGSGDAENVCKRLNEQQATISQLEEENDKLIQKNCIPCELVNLQTREIDKLKEENEKLQKQCFELEKDYLIETSDISDKIYLGDEIKELKQRYGVDDE